MPRLRLLRLSPFRGRRASRVVLVSCRMKMLTKANSRSPRCLILYSRRKRTFNIVKTEVGSKSATLAQDAPDKVSFFRRVDIIECAKPPKKIIYEEISTSALSRADYSLLEYFPFVRSSVGSSWSCARCSEGPMGQLNFTCSCCLPKRRRSGCLGHVIPRDIKTLWEVPHS